MVRIQVALDPTEASALSRWAASEMRDPREQIRWLVRQELERRGLLEPDDTGRQLAREERTT